VARRPVARIEQMRRELRELNNGLEIDTERVIILIAQNSPSEKPDGVCG
jgi:hypothetical protein